MPELTWYVLAPYVLILTAALAAGFVNAIAGGSTFFGYPAFVACGVPPALASASNNVGLWLGNAMAAFAYRSSRLFLEYFVDRRPVKKSIAVISLQRAALPLWSNFIKLLQSAWQTAHRPKLVFASATGICEPSCLVEQSVLTSQAEP
jgi:hypothetical protein